ncbi:hypothetical protein V5799_026905 [Amblyomma americanum]|uniref:DDE Tnp4 domain-containing protein n=1 Tax=Amblyomma americanum TaxID=6943 RepID=A0AAQ4DH85_AMBAM
MAFRIGIEAAREAIHLTCQVLWDVLSPLYMKPPTESEWRDIAAGFWHQWQFPKFLGAVDGKNVNIKRPKKCGSLYFNYKGTYSIVLMAVVESRYQFRLIDVGAPVRLSDGGIFKDSPIGKRLEKGKMNLPRAAQLPGSATTLPHVFIGDEAFQLRPDFMRPLPGSRTSNEEVIFNYRLSRARRCAENAFGILASRWKIYGRTIHLQPSNADSVVKETCILHNVLSGMSASESEYCPVGYADAEDVFGNVLEGAWRSEASGRTGMFELQGTRARKSSQAAGSVRRNFIHFFSNEGQVP